MSTVKKISAFLAGAFVAGFLAMSLVGAYGQGGGLGSTGSLIRYLGTLVIPTGKTVTLSNTMTQTATDGSTVAFGAGGTVVYSGGALGTPSSGVITNLTGTCSSCIASAVPASGLTGATLAAGVTASSLTSVGTLTSLTTSGAVTANTTSVNWFANQSTGDGNVQIGGVNTAIGALINYSQSGNTTLSVDNIYSGNAGSLTQFCFGAPGANCAFSFVKDGTITTNATIYASCTALTTNASGVIGCTASDPRLKSIDAIPFAPGLREIERIVAEKGVISFRGKPGNPENIDTRHQAGFNCWVIEKYIPLGTHRDNRGYCNLDPEGMQAAMFNAVATLATNNAALRSRVARLERNKR